MKGWMSKGEDTDQGFVRHLIPSRTQWEVLEKCLIWNYGMSLQGFDEKGKKGEHPIWKGIGDRED